MANEQNLKPQSERTKEEQRVIARQGGIKSGETRRRKADMRKAVANILNAEYNIKGKDEKLTGIDVLAINLFKIAQDPKNKQNIQATKMLLEIYGQDKNPIDEKIAKAQLKLLKTKIDMLTQGDTSSLDKLDEILKELQNNAIK